MYFINSNFPLNVFGVIIPTSMETVRELLSHKMLDYLEKGVMYRISKPLIGDSVLPTSHAAWAKQRPLVEKGFAHEVVGNAVPRAVGVVNQLANTWEVDAIKYQNNKVQNIEEDMLKLTMDVIGKAAFGFDFHSVTSDVAPLYQPFQTILHGLQRRGQLLHEHIFRFLPTEKNRKLNEALAKLNDCVDSILQSRREESIEQKAARTEDFLDHLMASDLSQKLIKDNIKTLLFAGMFDHLYLDFTLN